MRSGLGARMPCLKGKIVQPLPRRNPVAAGRIRSRSTQGQRRKHDGILGVAPQQSKAPPAQPPFGPTSWTWLLESIDSASRTVARCGYAAPRSDTGCRACRSFGGCMGRGRGTGLAARGWGPVARPR